MTSYLLDPFIQVNDNNGLTVPGAKVYVYKADTTVPAVTYRDFEGHPNTIPVIADSLGHVTVIAELGNLYDVVINYPDDTLLMSQKGLSPCGGGGEVNVQSDWNDSDPESDAYIRNKPFVSKVVYSDWQGDFGYDVNIPTLTIDSESHKVSGAGYDLGVMPPYPSTTESDNRALMLSSQSRVPSWQSVYSKSETDTLLGAKQPTLTAGTGIDLTDSVVSWDYSVGRNLYLNTNKEIQTDIPGGRLHPTSVAWTEVGSLGAVYKVIARANGTGTYEVGLRYTGSGASTTYTFIGKSFTTLDSSPSMSFSKIVNVAATLEYSTAFDPAFNPSSTESVTIEGTLILARIYDFRAVMYSDENGDVQVAFTAVEVGH